MKTKKKVSSAVIKRLPRYYRYLHDLLKLEIKRISSKELSERMGVTASQIRQDLNCFGEFGQQGYGYNVEMLFNEIGNILGLNKVYNSIIIGAGNMGRALANYSNFKKWGFIITGIFDIDKKVIGKKINNIEVMNFDSIDEFVRKNKTDIAIICVPYEQTPDITNKMTHLGIKGLWNFSPMDLDLSCDVTVENVHLSDSLMVLGYRLNNKGEK